MPPLECHCTHDEHRHNGKEKSRAYPHQALGTKYRREEILSGIETQTGKLERETERPQHEIGTAGRVGNHVYARTERAYENAHNNRTSGNT